MAMYMQYQYGRIMAPAKTDRAWNGLLASRMVVRGAMFEQGERLAARRRGNEPVGMAAEQMAGREEDHIASRRPDVPGPLGHCGSRVGRVWDGDHDRQQQGRRILQLLCEGISGQGLLRH